jgi:membrane-associated phospholipid phosphatase
MTISAKLFNQHRSAVVSSSVLLFGLFTAVAALLFFAWLAEQMREGDTLMFDNAIRGFVHDHANDALTQIMRALTVAGSTLIVSSLTCVVLLVFFIGRHWWSAIVFSVMMSGAVVLNFVLKHSFSRDRPTAYFETPIPDSYSFPSGHALFSLCFYGALAWIITRHMQGRLGSALVWIGAVILIIGVGSSRIYLGVHYPSDVLAGYTAAIIWLIAVAAADRWLSVHYKHLPVRHSGI